MDEWPSWRRGIMPTTWEGLQGKKEANRVIVFGMIAVTFGFTKLSGLTSKTSDDFCWESLISLLIEYPVSFTAQNWLAYLFIYFSLNGSFELPVSGGVRSKPLFTFDSLVSSGSKVLLGILILLEILTWTPESLPQHLPLSQSGLLSLTLSCFILLE